MLNFIFLGAAKMQTYNAKASGNNFGQGLPKDIKDRFSFVEKARVIAESEKALAIKAMAFCDELESHSNLLLIAAGELQKSAKDFDDIGAAIKESLLNNLTKSANLGVLPETVLKHFVAPRKIKIETKQERWRRLNAENGYTESNLNNLEALKERLCGKHIIVPGFIIGVMTTKFCIYQNIDVRYKIYDIKSGSRLYIKAHKVSLLNEHGDLLSRNKYSELYQTPTSELEEAYRKLCGDPSGNCCNRELTVKTVFTDALHQWNGFDLSTLLKDCLIID
jgi:hypothetical protein